MTETLYAAGALDSTAAFAVAAAVGVLFGFFLEQAGFGSSRRLASSSAACKRRTAASHTGASHQSVGR